jgi:exodeoxyribonuclease-3
MGFVYLKRTTNSTKSRQLKIVTWNCQGAFRKKAAFILQENPDIVVVPECEHPDKLKFAAGTKLPTDMVWFGDNASKGLGVFSYSHFRLKLLDVHNPAFKIILPILVSNGKVDFLLFAIWANNPQEKNAQYVEQVWRAIHHYEALLNNKHVILTGDFNSNTIWDRKNRKENHSELVKVLKQKNIHSIYHKHFKQEQGKEEHPTFFLQRNILKPYHLDYLFASDTLLRKCKGIEIGSHENWITYSDHSPVTATFKLSQ